MTVTRGRRHTRVRRFTVAGRAGANRAAFKKLRPGTYRVVLSAVDGAGNRARALARTLKVKRRHT